MKTILLLTSLSLYSISLSQSTMNYQKYIIHFEYGQSTISAAELKKWEDFKSTLPSKFSINELKAHTDTVSSEQFNLRLAKKRLNSVKKLLSIDYKITETVIGEREAQKSENYNDAEYRIVEINYLLTPAIIDEPIVKTEQSNLSKTIDQLIKNEDLKTIQFDLSILFQPGEAIYLPSSLPELDELYRIMSENKNLNIVIHGHVCCSSEPSLANSRAGAVYTFLQSNQISSTRMSIVGHDNRDPKVWPERTEEDRIANRRVTIEFLKQ